MSFFYNHSIVIISSLTLDGLAVLGLVPNLGISLDSWLQLEQVVAMANGGLSTDSSGMLIAAFPGLGDLACCHSCLGHCLDYCSVDYMGLLLKTTIPE